MRPKTHEFSRPLRVDRVPEGGCEERISADPEECNALARRMGLPAVNALSAVLNVEPARGKGLRVYGDLAASLAQTCVVSLENFESELRVPVERYFLPRTSMRSEDILAQEEDFDLIDSGEIDLGELVAETLALAIDPYPRKPGASFTPVNVESAAVENSAAKPFGDLARLKDQLARK